MRRRVFLLTGLVLMSGCTYNVRQRVNSGVDAQVRHTYDVAPESEPRPKSAKSPTEIAPGDAESSSKQAAPTPDVVTDVTATTWMESQREPARQDESQMDDGVQTVAFTQSPADESGEARSQRKLDLNIPPEFPGSEAKRVDLPKDSAALRREVNRIYPDLPPMPVEPQVLPGPGGKGYTLADLQSMAAANSPALRQAIADVEAARGNLIQSRTYQNPTTGWLFDPDNNNTASNTQGGFIDQVIRTGGKMKLGVAVAQKNLDIAELALKRARSDLATAVRNSYFTLLVDVETLTVTRALAQFTDEMYLIQKGLLNGALAAPYEPASLRAQAFTNRLMYKQAIASYIYDWKQLVATIGDRQLPLTEVAGRVDRLIPYYEYDRVLNHALHQHTDILTSRLVLQQAQYNLKLAQVTPIPDLELRASLERDKALFPFGTYSQFSVSFPLVIWDQNKGGIIAAQAALTRASEETHRVEVTLTSNLATAYANYQNNLFAIEYYRRNILPDLVRYYRGIHARRQIDPNSPFGDLVAAQQNLASNVTSYLGVLQNLWTSAVAVADFLQTDDLFQMATPREAPELQEFNELWPCDHGTSAAASTYHDESGLDLGAVPGGGPGKVAAGGPQSVPSQPVGRLVALQRADRQLVRPVSTVRTQSDETTESVRPDADIRTAEQVP